MKTDRPWVLTIAGKQLVRNIIYIGDMLPDFLRENTQRLTWTLMDENGVIIDDDIRIRIKNTIKAYLIRKKCKIIPKRLSLKDPVKYVDGVRVSIKKVTGKGWGIIIGGKRRDSVDVSRDTMRVRNFLEKKGIVIENKSICPSYCNPRTDEEILIKENRNVI